MLRTSTNIVVKPNICDKKGKVITPKASMLKMIRLVMFSFQATLKQQKIRIAMFIGQTWS